MSDGINDGRLLPFRLYWRDGKTEVIHGKTIADAFNNAGYGGGAMAALDTYTAGDGERYQWNKSTKRWEFKEEAPPVGPSNVIEAMDALTAKEQSDAYRKPVEELSVGQLAYILITTDGSGEKKKRKALEMLLE